MNSKIINKTNSPIVEFTLDKGEEIKIERGSMIYMDPNIEIKGKKNGGFFGALGKSMFGGEGFFKTHAISREDNQKIAVSPKGLGDVYKIELTGTDWYLEDGVFIASSNSVDYDVKKQSGLGNAIFGGTGGFFILKTSGMGELYVESFGSIVEIQLNDESMTIDNDHIIGWESTLKHEISIASGAFGFKTGEGLVTNLSGTGKLIIQTRKIEDLAYRLIPFMPTRSN